MKEKINKKAYLFFIGPALILLMLFAIIPIIITFFISFTDLSLVGLANWSKVNFIGLENYQKIFIDPVFRKAITNTIFYVVVGVPLVVVISLTLAVLINSGKNWVFKTFRVLYYLPSITNTVAVAVVWAYLYNPSIGLLNHILSWFNIAGKGWLTDPAIAKISLIILAVWRAVGLNMIIFLAALQGIPESLYEAASIDGAGRFKKLMNITIPQMKFSIFFVSVTTMIGWIQFFEEPFIMTDGGPLNSTTSVALFIYRNGFKFSKFGYSAAGSFILFITIIIVTLLQFRIQSKENEINV